MSIMQRGAVSGTRVSLGESGSRASGPEAGGAAVQLTQVSKVYGQGRSSLLALDKVSLTVAPGEFVCLIGASGCGKSTMLSLVAGLDTPTAGQVSTGGKRVTLMFQEPALFPWLTSAKNVELALRARGVPERSGGPAPRSCWRPFTSAASAASGRTSCPAACASGSQWPGRWHRMPTCC